ncbi:unnamed protein product [Clavelina lepadiformis]|uniref:Uncharacterized protein n=1 Tax=Clavelina lepadiformis TaxID=159417 RepID=A0ABP0GRL4_CLALP
MPTKSLEWSKWDGSLSDANCVIATKSEGWMPARMGRLSTGSVGSKHPVTVVRHTRHRLWQYGGSEHCGTKQKHNACSTVE